MIYDRIIDLCKQHDLRITTLLKELKIATGAATNWKRGTVPNSDALIKLSEYFNVPVDYILFGTEPTIPTEYQSLINSYKELSKDNQQLLQDIISSMIDIQTANEKRSKIKLMTIKLMSDKVSAGTGYDLNDENFEEIQIVDTPEAEVADYALVVEGESMFPDFHDGDIVLVKEQPEIEIGQVGIFIYNNEGYIKERGKDYLISRNPEFDNIMPTEDDQVICKGLVLGIAEQVE